MQTRQLYIYSSRKQLVLNMNESHLRGTFFKCWLIILYCISYAKHSMCCSTNTQIHIRCICDDEEDDEGVSFITWACGHSWTIECWETALPPPHRWPHASYPAADGQRVQLSEEELQRQEVTSVKPHRTNEKMTDQEA